MSVPAVMGLELPLQELDGQELIIDGGNGDVIIQPSGAVLAEYEQLILQAKAFDDLVAKEALLPSETQDGCPVSVLLNARLSLDVDSCLMDCSDGVGLYRTEIPFYAA